MDSVNTEVPINISDLRACLVAMDDGNWGTAYVILEDLLEEYTEEIEDGT